MEVHYIDTGFPYTATESFMDFFDGLTHVPLNYATSGPVHDQVFGFFLLQFFFFGVSVNMLFFWGFCKHVISSQIKVLFVVLNRFGCGVVYHQCQMWVVVLRHFVLFLIDNLIIIIIFSIIRSTVRVLCTD